MLTSPSNKSYVGQTKRTIEIRWNEHIAEATDINGRDTSRLLNRAIRKYGAENFKIKELCKCPNEDLDSYEVYYIALHDTLANSGYNLTTGGNSGCEISENTRNYRSEIQRKHQCEFNLPTYVRLVKGDNYEGFAVEFPEGKSHKFIRNNESLEEKYRQAMEAHTVILAGGEYTKNRPPTERQTRTTLPQYITFDRYRNIFAVRKPGYPHKWFSSKKLSTLEKRQLAIDYLNSLK